MDRKAPKRKNRYVDGFIMGERAQPHLRRVTNTEFHDARRVTRDALLHVAQHSRDQRAAQAALARLWDGWKVRLPLRDEALRGVVGSAAALDRALTAWRGDMEL